MRSTAALIFAMLYVSSAGLRAADTVTSDYPNRPLRLITGFLPGGISDTLARVVGETWRAHRSARRH